jgi:hypothetical protein
MNINNQLKLTFYFFSNVYVKREAMKKITNVSWLCVPFGALISLMICNLFLFFSSKEELAIAYYVTTIKLTGSKNFFSYCVCLFYS